MKYFLLLLTCSLAASASLQAQNVPYAFKKYGWGEEIPMPVLSAEEKDAEAVLLRDYRFYDMMYDANGKLQCYKTFHRRVQVLSLEGIEEFNKVYLPLAGVEEILEIRARTISPAGEVRELSRNSIKEIENVEDKGAFKIFALEGVELNGEVEYIYSVKIEPKLFGGEYLQGTMPKRNVRFRIICPKNLKFASNIVNGQGTVTDSVNQEEGFRMLEFNALSVPALRKEEYSAYEAQLLRMDYKLAYNFSNGNTPLYTFSSLNEYTAQTYFDLEEKDIKAALKFAGKEIVEMEDKQEAFYRFESKVKTSIGVHAAAPPRNVKELVEMKSGTAGDILKLYVAFAKGSGMKYEIVYTCDRYDAVFSDAFESYNLLHETLIHFPEYGVYASPADLLSRIGYVSPNLSGNYGLFVRPVVFAGIVSATKDRRMILPLEAEKSRDLIFVEVDFRDNMTGIDFSIRREMTGLSARMVQPAFAYLKDEKERQPFIDAYLKLFEEDTEIRNVKISGDGEQDLYKQPLRLSCDATSTRLVETAGSKYMLRIGELIGRQAEIYNPGKRMLPVSNAFNKMYVREVIVNIPAGFKVLNPDEINSSEAITEEDGSISAAFKSGYRIDGNKIIITIEEYYRQIDYPVSRFEDFRKVINAAADFNKLVLAFDKE